MKKIYLVWLLSICILPFFQGGYFYHEALYFGLAQGVILLFIMYKKKTNFKLTSYRCLYLLIILASLISTISAVDQGMHLVGVLKLLIPFVFIINLDSFYQEYKDIVIKDLKILYILITAVMIISLIVTLLFFDSNHAIFQHFVQNTRIGGFFQYANTFGIYIYASLIILFVTPLSNKFRLTISILFVVGIVMTQSRGLLIILVLSLLILAVFNAKGLRFIYLGSFVGIAIGQGILWWIKDNVDVFRGVALLDNTSEWLIRLLYYEDSLPMIMKRLTGYGHLGYYYTHQFFQTGASYKVKYLHNSLLQITLDYGFIAGIALLLIGIYGCVLLYREYKINKFIDVRNEGFILQLGGLGVFAHTLVDFDFQFTALVILYLFILFLIEENYSVYLKKLTNKKPIRFFELLKGNYLKKKPIIARLLNSALVVLVGILVFSFAYIGTVSYLDYNLASVEAYNMYPKYTDALDHILKGQNTGLQVTDNDKVEMAIAKTNENPYYLKGFAFLRDYYYNNGDLEMAIKYGEKVYLLAPLHLGYYEEYVKISMKYILDLYRQNELDYDNQYLKALLNMNQYILKLESNREKTYNVKHKVSFELTEDMTKISDKAQEIYKTIQK